MLTKKYRTQTIFAEKDNGVAYTKSGKMIFPLGIDSGYGGFKLYGPNICATFPSYAKIIDSDAFIKELTIDDIIYKDLNTGITWLVGRSAQNGLQLTNTSDTIEALCGRNRYFSPMFKVLIETAIGIGLMDTKNVHHKLPEGESPYIQAGLPCQYIDADAGYLTDVLVGPHDFSIQIGRSAPIEVHINIPKDHVNKIIRQPMGAFVSTTTDLYWHQNVTKFANSNVLIYDPGFKTLDTFSIRGGFLDSKESWQDLGMSRILTETSKQILKDFDMDIPAAHMQKYLETGEFSCSSKDRRVKRTAKVDFSYILEQKSYEICKEALDKAYDMYDSFLDYDYLIVSGGTGAAWKEWIKDELKDMSTLTVMADNTVDGMPMYFSNARGYYSFAKASIAEIE